MPSNYSAETNPLGPHKLKTAYLIAANDFMIGQLNAYVILQQPDLDIAKLEPGLATAIRTYQDRMKKNARFMVTKFMPDFITTLDGGTNFSHLIESAFSPDMVAHIVKAHQDTEAARTTHEIASALARQAGEIRVAVETLKDDYEVNHEGIHQYVGDYRHNMAQAVALLGSSAKEMSSEIDALQKIISECLSEIVKGGDEVGEGITKLITKTLTTIASAPKDDKPRTDLKPAERPKLVHDSDDPDQSYDEDDGDDDDDYDILDDALPDTTAQADFVVNAIEVSRDGVSRVSGAVHRLRTTNAKLADAYQQLARENVQMAMAKVIQVQNQLYLDGLEQLGANAKSLKHEWSAVESAYQAFSQQAGSANGQAEAVEMGHAAEGAKSLWKALGSQLTYVKSTMPESR